MCMIAPKKKKSSNVRILQYHMGIPAHQQKYGCSEQHFVRILILVFGMSAIWSRSSRMAQSNEGSLGASLI